jgi:hypothetical protein
MSAGERKRKSRAAKAERAEKARRYLGDPLSPEERRRLARLHGFKLEGD